MPNAMATRDEPIDVTVAQADMSNHVMNVAWGVKVRKLCHSTARAMLCALGGSYLTQCNPTSAFKHSIIKKRVRLPKKYDKVHRNSTGEELRGERRSQCEELALERDQK